ncbi:MAG: NUDIX domain-containing protein [Candidatus Saccharibacteria bacterium]
MQIKDVFDKYLQLYPNEVNNLRLLSEQLKQADDITTRENFVGHVTASAFIVNEHTKQVLLLEHKTLGKLLQPGGHIDPGDTTLVEAALREIEEETGLRQADLMLRPVLPNERFVPFDVNTHYIPENPKKAEPGHYHHDFRYIYTTQNSSVEIDLSESSTYKWVDWDDFASASGFVHIADKMDMILEPSARDFFRSLTDETSKGIAVVAVSHIIPSSEAYIRSLHDNFNLVGIIPKPKSIDARTRQLLDNEHVAILDQFTRENLTSNPEDLVSLLRPFDKICLVDIGGYFSDIVDILKEKLGSKLLGVVEDTENGHQKYEQRLSGKCAVMSVARSPLKDFEDQLVGHSVAHATETVLRQINLIITYRDCGVIGYGKIGSGIADYLRQRGIRPRVSELDSLRAVRASCDGAIVCSTEELIRKSDIIFCATGTRALDLLKFRDIRRGAFLASVTSSDDEFDLKFVDCEYEKEVVAEHITRYSKRGHHFHLLNDGNAINFLYSAAVDKYINLVQGELIFSVMKLSGAKAKAGKTIIVNTPEDHKYISQLWLDYIMRGTQF